MIESGKPITIQQIESLSKDGEDRLIIGIHPMAMPMAIISKYGRIWIEVGAKQAYESLQGFIDHNKHLLDGYDFYVVTNGRPLVGLSGEALTDDLF